MILLAILKFCCITAGLLVSGEILYNGVKSKDKQLLREGIITLIFMLILIFALL